MDEFVKYAMPYAPDFIGQLMPQWKPGVNNRTLLIAQHPEHGMVGYINHWLGPQGEVQIGKMHTLPQYQRQGVNTWMVNNLRQQYGTPIDYGMLSPDGRAWAEATPQLQRAANILDAIQPTLSPLIWDKSGSEKPELKPRVAHWITRHVYQVLESGGYSDPAQWLQLVLTGSLTTYQYSRDSDCDISLFVNSSKLPEWSRAEMIGLMIESADGVKIPGTPYPMQCFVVGRQIKPHDLYQKGLRSGYDIKAGHWIEPPDHDRDHDVEQQENGFYTYALEVADKMEKLLRYEPEKAVMMWQQIHHRRQRDQIAGKGDFSQANIVYKFLSNRGLFPKIADLSGEYIASFQPDQPAPMMNAQEWSAFEQNRNQGTKSCPWCNRQHPYDFDISQCPTRLERLRQMYPSRDPNLPPLPPDEPAPLLADKEVTGGWKFSMYAPITQEEARGDSPPVSHEEFQQLAAEGHQKHNALAQNTAPTTGLDANWPALKEHSWQQVQQPWGGATIDSHTGVPVQSNANLYALTAKEPGYQTVSVPIGANREQFHAAMDRAKQHFQPLLERQQHHLGVFRDDDEGRIDFDPTLVLDNLHDVHSIGAYTHAIGGAYNFADGNGYFPPHVADTSPQPAQGAPIPPPME